MKPSKSIAIMGRMTTFHPCTSFILMVLENYGLSHEELGQELTRVYRNPILSKLYLQALMIDLVSMVEEDPTGLLREQQILDQALSFIDNIEQELMALLDEIGWLLDKVKGDVCRVLRIHIQKPDTLTIEVLLA